MVGESFKEEFQSGVGLPFFNFEYLHSAYSFFTLCLSTIDQASSTPPYVPRQVYSVFVFHFFKQLPSHMHVQISYLFEVLYLTFTF